MKWSRWKDIEDLPEYDSYAIYEIGLVNKKGREIPINRFLGKDKIGILCIGETINLRRRISHFRYGEKHGSAHSEGNLMWVLKEYSNTLKKKHKEPRYKYRFKEVSSKNKAKKEESLLIKGYFKRYGEVPPLNSNIPDSENLEGWKKSRFL